MQSTQILRCNYTDTCREEVKMNILKIFFNKFFNKKCEFMDVCPLYELDSVTCNKEPGSYCGKRRSFANNNIGGK